MLRKLVFTLMVLAIGLFGAAPVSAQGADLPFAPGAVYLMSNAPDGNAVSVYSRFADGRLVFSGSYETGGLGSGVGVTVPADPLGSQNSLLLSPNGQWLFAVNAGSDDISVFRVLPQGLRLTDRVRSSGEYPVSLTYMRGLVYVLNAAGDGSISGFRLSPNGQLRPLDGSTRSLNAATPADGDQPQILESPSQVSFSPSGRFLVVIDKGGVSGVGKILTFAVGRNGRPADEPVVTETASPVPFAATFDLFGHMVVVDANAGSITSYRIQRDGALATLDSETNGQAAVCWIANARGMVFTDNTGSGTISALKIARDGSLTLLGENGYSAMTGDGSLPLDMGISREGRFIYSILAGAGSIGITRINRNGSLEFVDTAGEFPVNAGVQGIAVR